MSEALRVELRRKAFHALGFLYAGLYAWAGRTPTLLVLGAAAALLGGLEAWRLRDDRVNERLVRAFGGVHRERELHRPSGIFWTLSGCLLAALALPDPDIALAAMLYLAVGDGVAGFAGKTLGHLRIGAKSAEGSLACFLAAWAVGMVVLVPGHGRVGLEAAIGALAAAAFEALALGPDDNLSLPVLSGLAVTVARRFIL